MSFHGLLAGAGALGAILMVVVMILLVVSAIYLGFGMRRAAIAHEEHVRAMWAIAQALARSAPGEPPAADPPAPTDEEPPPSTAADHNPAPTAQRKSEGYKESATLTDEQLNNVIAVFATLTVIGIVVATFFALGWGWPIAIGSGAVALIFLFVRLAPRPK